jgi:hypothetical protein
MFRLFCFWAVVALAALPADAASRTRQVASGLSKNAPPASAAPREFDPHKDGFAFANETSFAYGLDEAGRLTMGRKETPPPFAHRCICMIRGAMKFWKFARFEPRQPKLSAAEYRRRVKELFSLTVWRGPRSADRRIVFPGYANLWDFSQAQRRMLQEEIGAWLPTYLRVGNWRMASPLTFLTQGHNARVVAGKLPAEPQGIFLTEFPSMNHAVLAYAATRLPDGRTRFKVYDPNYPGQPARLDYVPERRLFDFERRFYWPGGYVRMFRIFISPIH